jgi:actin-like ATPase involved in cell morphogenesis
VPAIVSRREGRQGEQRLVGEGVPTVYVLGIDVGTTFTAAAVLRNRQAEICPLGTRSATIPSVVLLREDGEMLVGEAAERRAVTEPERVAREFKRRCGDSTPLVLGGTPMSPEALTASVITAVVADVTTRQGAAPAAICLSHPANWSPFKTDLLRQTVRLADLDVPVRFVTEPEAAAIDYAHARHLDVGETVAVYDLGGGTFDAAVVRRTQDGFAVLGNPEGIDRLGGTDIDAAVFDHVSRSLDGRLADLDEDDPGTVAAMARLRRECTEAKEALSGDTDTSIPIILPGLTTAVRLTRGELETMVRPALQASIGALRRALRSAGLAPEDLSAVLLVGGSSRIPLVAELVGAELGRPVAVDTEPKHAVALGAALLAGEATSADLSVDLSVARSASGSVDRQVGGQGARSLGGQVAPHQLRRRAVQAAATVALVGSVTAGVLHTLDHDEVRAVARVEQSTALTPAPPTATPSLAPPTVMPPAAVSGLTVSRGRPTGSTLTSMVVSWTASPGATSYLVEWLVTGSGAGPGTRTTTSTSATLTGLVPDTRYTVRVTPGNAGGVGPPAVVEGATDG